MYQNNPAYMYPQQHQMQQQQQQQQMRQHQMRQHQQQEQQRMQMQHQHQHQQRMQMQMHQQQQQQILQARKKQVREKHQQPKTDKAAQEEDEEEDDEEEDDDDESFSSLSDLSDSQTDDTESESESESDSESGSSPPPMKVSDKSRAKTKTKPEASPKSKSKSKSKPKSSAPDLDADDADDLTASASASASADDMTREMEKLAVTNASPARIPSSAATQSPAEYLYGVISDVLDTNNKKNFQRILSRTPIPIALVYLHQIAQKAIATGNREIYKVVIDTNKKYNIVSDLYIDAMSKGDRKSISNAMDYLGKTVNAFRTGAHFNIDELLKFFTPEFIAMNLIQAGNIEAYDKVMTEFKNEEIRISRGFHVAKPLLAAYFGVPGFFSNQKRYTFNRDIVVLSICGGSVETLDYVIKKTKMGKISHDIVLEARSCQPIPAHMMKHLVEKYNVSEMSV